MQALGGAKNHMVVLPDADIDMAADAAVSAGYGSAGERCMAVSVVVAVGDVADPLVDAIAERLPQLRDRARHASRTAEMGPLITREHRDKVASATSTTGRRDGATVVVDGRDARSTATGFFLGAVPARPRQAGDGRSYDDEIFGPVLVVVRVDTYDEALALVNDNPYGNGTRDLHPRRRRGPPVPVRRQLRHGRA